MTEDVREELGLRAATPGWLLTGACCAAAAGAFVFAIHTTARNRTLTEAQSDSLSHDVQSRIVGHRPKWLFFTSRRDSVGLESTNGNWRLLILSKPQCVPCELRTSSVVRQLQAISSSSVTPELWVISDGLTSDTALISLAERLVVRQFRGATEDVWSMLGIRSVPVLLVIDPSGTVRRASVGYHRRIDDSLVVNTAGWIGGGLPGG